MGVVQLWHGNKIIVNQILLLNKLIMIINALNESSISTFTLDLKILSKIIYQIPKL
jgi:hypothetical protein